MDMSQFTSDGKFLMLALDHRGSIKKLINPQDPDGITDKQVITLKKEIIDALKEQFSGLLIDETYGLGAYPIHSKPFLLPLEKSGYRKEGADRITELEYTCQQLIELGASGAKLLLYFNSQVTSAKVQLETAKKAIDDCQKNNLPFFLEIVTYAEDGIHEKAGLVIESLRSFYEVGIVPDVWKLEYPGSADSSLEISRLVGNTPWIVLTGGVSFEEFTEQLKEAVKAGASGFLAGRALWQEVTQLQGDKKEQFLKQTLPERFRTIAEIAKTS